jgi:hypothetical protein
MSDNNLQAIVDVASQEPPELPRLTVANTFIYYQRVGIALVRAKEAFDKIPDSTPVGCTDELKSLIKECEGVIKGAARLLEANR